MIGTSLVIVGGGFVGRAVAAVARARGAHVELVDRHIGDSRFGTWHQVDLLVDEVTLPAGRVIVSVGDGNPRPRRPWESVLANAMTVARVAPRLAGRDVVFTSSAEVYGSASGALTEESVARLPVDDAWLARWANDALELAGGGGPSHRFEQHCRLLSGADPSGRWVYAMAKRAQELTLQAVVDADRLTILRIANVIGPGQVRAATRFAMMADAGLALRVSEPAQRTFVGLDDVVEVILSPPGPGVWNVGGHMLTVRRLAKEVLARLDAETDIAPVPVPATDTSGVLDDSRLREHRPVRDLGPMIDAVVESVRARAAVFDPPLPLIRPPRPARPSWLAARMAEALWNGELKAGRRWSSELRTRLAEQLALPDDRRLELFGTGTAALHYTVLAIARHASPGDIAVLPTFTYPATAEVLALLGYELRFVDVDPSTWTIDPKQLATVLAAEPRVSVVVGVDTLGNPLDYGSLRRVCDEQRVAFVADSAAAIGARYRGRAVGAQADGHAFSLSFAKALSAGGAGGAAVVPVDATIDAASDPRGLSPLSELHAVAAVDQLAVLPELLAARARVAAFYDDVLGGVLTPQQVTTDGEHARVHYSALVAGDLSRDELRARLDGLGVRTGRYFSPTLHDGPWHSHWLRSGRAPLPVSTDLARRVISLPLSSEMTPEEAEHVAFAVRIAVRDMRAAAR